MSKVTLVLVLVLALAAVTFAATPVNPTTTRAEIVAAVTAYIDAQNRGDVYDMMSMVSRRDDVVSISDGQIERGWQTIRNSNAQLIRNGAPSGRDMTPGREMPPGIKIGEVDVMVLGPTAAVAVAPFTFSVAVAQGFVLVPGASTLVFEKSGTKWLVVHEHTSITTQEVARGIE